MGHVVCWPKFGLEKTRDARLPSLVCCSVLRNSTPNSSRRGPLRKRIFDTRRNSHCSLGRRYEPGSSKLILRRPCGRTT